MDLTHITVSQARTFDRLAFKDARWGDQTRFEMLDGELAALLIHAGVDAPVAGSFAMDCVN